MSRPRGSNLSPSSTVMSRTAESGSSSHAQRDAPASVRRAAPYFFPALRLEAATRATSNSGWSCKATTNCWPAIPVTPTMPALSLLIMRSWSVLVNASRRWLSHVPLLQQVLGDEHGPGGGAHLGVVADEHELDPVVERPVLAEAADGGGHAIAPIAVVLRLR